MKKIIWITAKILLWTVGIALSLLILMEIILSGPILTRIVSKVAAEYVDGDIHFGKVSASMFRRFPATVLTLEDFNITYPADRFDSIEKAGAQSHLIQRGCSEEADTLVSFKKFAVGVNLPPWSQEQSTYLTSTSTARAYLPIAMQMAARTGICSSQGKKPRKTPQRQAAKCRRSSSEES